MHAKFVEFAVDRIIKDAQKDGNSALMKTILQNESIEEVTSRIMVVQDGLAMAYITQKGETLSILDFQECAQKIAEELKKRILG